MLHWQCGVDLNMDELGFFCFGFLLGGSNIQMRKKEDDPYHSYTLQTHHPSAAQPQVWIWGKVKLHSCVALKWIFGSQCEKCAEKLQAECTFYCSFEHF